MLKDITFGQYFPAQSVIHSMDARVKMVLVIALIVFIFLTGNVISLMIMTAAVFAVIGASHIPLRVYLKCLKPIIPIIILTSILNALYVSGGIVLVDFWVITITTQGLMTAAFMSVRIALLILASSLLTYTTSPTELTDAIERLLSPLNYIRLDVHSLAMMMTIALRFVPTLVEETDKIMSAQKARGADLESGGLVQRVKALMPILIPLLISSFRRAAELADAMECRCYHGGKGRTRMKQMHMVGRDYVAILLAGLLLGAILCSNHWLDGVLFSLIQTIF